MRTSKKSLSLTVLLISGSCFAQQTRLNQTATSKKPFKISTTLTTTSSLHETGTVDAHSQASLTIVPIYRWNKTYTVKGQISLLQDFGPSKELSTSNTTIGIQRKSSRLLGWAITPSINGTLPSDERDRKDNSFYGAINLKALATRDLEIFSRPTTFGSATSAQKNFHQWTRTAGGSANTNYAIRESIFLDQSLTEKTTLEIYFSYRAGWTYQDSLRSSFGLGQSFIFRTKSGTSISLSHENGGNALESNGRDHKISWYDANASTVSAAISMLF